MQKTICRQSLECSSRTKSTKIGDTHDGNEDNGVEYGWEYLDASKLDSNDEGRVTRCRTFSTVQRAVRRHDQADEQKVDSVEDEDTVDDLLRGFWDLFLWVDCFGRGQSGQLGASVGEGGGDEDAAKAVESVEEGGIRGVPISTLSVSGRLPCPRKTNQYLPPI